MKISIIGHGGGGKSTLARKISDHFNIPHLEIDRLWFKHGGHDLYVRGNATEEEKDVVRKKIADDVRTFISENSDWVIDGTYTKIQPMVASVADDLVYIRRPLLRRMFSHLFRIIKKDNRHPETTMISDALFTRKMVEGWLKGEYQKVENFVFQYENKLVRLKSFKEINLYFESLVEKNKF